jgi:hypothetical protein
MRRMKFISLGLLAIVLVACGGGDDEGGDGGGSNNPAATNTASVQQENPPVNTIAFPTNPPLPPAATIDTSGTGNSNTGSTAQPTGQPSAFPTRGGRSTLPPTWTPAGFQGSGQTGNTPVGSTPGTDLSTNLAPPTVEPTVERNPICADFSADYVQNQPSEQHYIQTELTIYWFPIAAEGVVYLVQLYDVTGVAVYSVEVPVPQVTFEAAMFPTAGTYAWSVIAYQNGAVVSCGAIDDEIFVFG